MKKIYSKVLGIIAVTSLLCSSCKKEGENIFNMFSDVTVTFHSDSPNSVADYKEVNPGDVIKLDYTITSAKTDMYVICVFENGSAIPFVKIPLDDSQRRSYSGVTEITMDKKVGKSTYRVWALDSAGVYMGDGYKSVTVEVNPDYLYWSDRDLFLAGVADTVTHNSDPFFGEKSYYSVRTGETFSYLEGAANSAKIDFGAAVTLDPTKTGDDALVVSLYSLTANPVSLPHYDTSTWTDKGTLFSASKAGQASAWKALRTGKQIVDAAKKAKPTAKLATALKVGSLFYFLTTDGEYGAIYVNYFRIVDGKPSIGIDVKIKPVEP